MNGIGRFETERGTVWKIRYRVPLAPGQRVTKQITETLMHCESRKQAEGVLAMRRADIFQGTYRPKNTQKPITVSQMVETFLDARKTELADLDGYARTLRKHVVRLLGKRFLFEVNTSSCEDYRRSRLAEGAAQATVRKELRYLQSVYVEARKRNIVTHDPVSDVSFKKLDNARTSMPTPVELHKLVEAALSLPPHDYLRPVFFMLMCTGMRISSVMSTRWEDVDFEACTLATKQKGNKWVRPPMSSLLRAELAQWKPWSEAQSEHGWVFPSPRFPERALTRHSAGREWPRLLAAAGITGITRHDMRRWMVTALKGLTGDGKTIGAVSGHSTMPMIDRYDQGAHDRAAPLVEAVTDLKSISERAKSLQERDDAKAKPSKQ